MTKPTNHLSKSPFFDFAQNKSFYQYSLHLGQSLFVFNDLWIVQKTFTTGLTLWIYEFFLKGKIKREPASKHIQVAV